MDKGVGWMSVEEADRVVVIRDVVEKRLRQSEAAERLGIGVRQVKRLARRYRERGTAGLASGHRARRPNNAIEDVVRGKVLELVRARYPDFGPTFAREKPVEVHGHRLSVETARLDDRGRAVAGEGAAGGSGAPEPTASGVRGGPGADRRFAARLVRGPWAGVHADLVRRRCDDAPAGVEVLPGGDDRGVHGDDAGAFDGTRAAGGVLLGPVQRVPGQQEGQGGRVDAVLAGFADAGHRRDPGGQPAGEGRLKPGRVERANRTLQDRLVKEMRLRGIGDIGAGNAYLPEFMADFNRRFAVAPRTPEDAHRAVLHDAAELDLILCEHHARKLTKNLTIGFRSREYQVTGRGNGYRLRGAEVTVCKAFDGSVTVLRDGRELPVRLLAAGEEAAPVEDEKTVVRRVDRAKAEQRSRPTYKPPPDHPWRRPFKPEAAGTATG